MSSTSSLRVPLNARGWDHSDKTALQVVRGLGRCSSTAHWRSIQRRPARPKMKNMKKTAHANRKRGAGPNPGPFGVTSRHKSGMTARQLDQLPVVKLDGIDIHCNGFIRYASVQLAAEPRDWRPACVASTMETGASFSSETDMPGLGKRAPFRARIPPALLARTALQ
jgi:hypothetical protein